VSLDDRFDDMIASLGGFYRAWFVHVGLELGLFARLRRAGSGGMTAAELAADTGTDPELVERWAWGADAHDLVEIGDGRLILPDDVAMILLDPDRSEYLGGQYLLATTGSLDYDVLPDLFRSGRTAAARPNRYRTAIERLTVQDIAVFFQEVLAVLPQLVVGLRDGAPVIDIHCGGGRWLVAMARRFPDISLIGVEFEPDSVARARANVTEAGLADRIRIEQDEVTAVDHVGEVQLAYFQYALHQLPDPVAALRSAWAAVRPGGWLVVLDWYLPSDPDELRTRHAELIAGFQLDELRSGTRLVTRSEALGWLSAAEVPTPELLDLPSGASAIVAQRP
jgi:SAM-dependent methyltransferase